MCGRFVQLGPVAVYAAMFDIEGRHDALACRYNVAPTQSVMACREQNGRRELQPLRWGLVPQWSKGPDSRYRMINARTETVHQQPAYRGPFRSRRCLIPAEAFYEWRPVPGGKQPYAIRMKSRAPFVFAGLWDSWAAPDGAQLETCALIVTDANALLRPIHDRMPAILAPELWDRWLDSGFRDIEALRGMLAPYDEAEMEAFQISRRVSSPANDGAELLEPVDVG
ncbi:SOS response-associated peptidase [Candidatus Thiosymbion oneisti]|uniref:SOS response-associated peptidase n=1 Tax=Candidatus Thiosymbion oneisti TaxID=589554 RepID=UPI000A596645|nr:SOS response-associated peptidase [Candidatus Thiosymbion oneisti]